MKLSLESRRSITGYMFVSPFIVGFILFVLAPFLQSLLFSISNLELTTTGYTLHFVGAENYRYALQVHADFTQNLTTSLGTMLVNVFWILIFSFFAAVLLNQKFKGRLLARVIFFMPVILASGIILRIEQQDYLMHLLEAGISEDVATFFGGVHIESFLMQLRLPERLLETIMIALDNFTNIIRASGIQILVFLAGLQSVNPSLYEAADVEGASRWESFWMITLPLVSPLIVTNLVYTVIDFFVSPENEVVHLIRSTTYGGAGFGAGSAMAWIYFFSIATILFVLIFSASRFIFYQE